MMKKIAIIAATILAGGAGTKAAAQSRQSYYLEKQISVPGNGGFDYLTIDRANHHLFVSHENKVDVIDLRTEQPVDSITGMEGVHGIALAPELNKGFISDGRGNSVVAFDLKTLKKGRTIPVSGKGPDAILYDPFTKRVCCFNAHSGSASVIDARSEKELGVVALGGDPEFGVSDAAGRVYDNLEDKGSVVLIDPVNMKVKDSFSLAPSGGPTALALDKAHQRLFSGCRADKNLCVLDTRSGKVIQRIPIGAGVDAIAYDPENHLIICSNGDATATIIEQQSADQYRVVQTLNTVPRAKTMAFDAATRTIYFSSAKFETGSRTPLPGSFQVLVYQVQ